MVCIITEKEAFIYFFFEQTSQQEKMRRTALRLLSYLRKYFPSIRLRERW